ncbi:MAG: hypothetical protein MUP16_11725 [Sedimentisphaerales bacterium]|nr:hypothetical protein [Sedimentisphaerales bacterium]
MPGYIITWTTYGSWLQGDFRGYVKDSCVLESSDALQRENVLNLKSGVVQLNQQEQQIVRDAILKESQNLGQEVYALAVCSNHVHIVANRISESIEMVVSHYKNAARLALQANGFVGKVWTRGFDKRFCFTRQSLEKRIRYVEAHKKHHNV